MKEMLMKSADKALVRRFRFVSRVFLALLLMAFSSSVLVAEPLLSAREASQSPTPVTKQEVTQGQAVQQLVSALQVIDRFRATFTQLTQDAEGATLQEIRGSMQWRRPRQFRWRITEPYQQTLVVVNDKLWIVDDDLEQVTIQRLSEQATGPTPAVLLSGDPAEIEQHYRVEHDKLPGGTQRFTLTPRNEEALFDQLRVVFRDELLVEMDFSDSLGQRTAINFADASRQFTQDAGVFQVAIPDGYDVVDDE